MTTAAYYLFGIMAVGAMITVYASLNFMGIHPFGG